MAGGKALVALLCAVVAVGTAATALGGVGARRDDPAVSLRPRVIDLFQSAAVSVSGLTAGRAGMRVLGAIDERGLAYRWTPYPWRNLRLVHGTWHGLLPAPALPGIYELQLRVGDGGELLASTHWLLRVFPNGTSARPSFSTALAAVRDFVARLPGNQVLVAQRRWPQAEFDHRDPRLNRLFVIAYAPRADSRPSSRLGLFVTTVRDGFRGGWRVLQATTQPYDARALG